jgi:hypothetical protein
VLYRSVVAKFDSQGFPRVVYDHRIIHQIWTVLQGDHGSVIGSWICTFEWNKPPHSVKLPSPETLRKLNLVLSKAVNLQHLGLPLIYPNSPFMSSSLNTLRVVSIATTFDSIGDMPLIFSCSNLEELYVDCEHAQTDSTWRANGCVFPKLRVLSVDTSNNNDIARAFMQCEYPSLKHLAIRSWGRGHDSDNLLRSFLARFPALDYLHLHTCDDLSKLMSIISPSTLDLCVPISDAAEFVRAISPRTHTLKIKLDLDLDDVGTQDILKALLEERTTLKRVSCRLWDINAEPQSFSWKQQGPDWFKDEDVEPADWRSFMERLGDYSQRLSQRGIALCDTHGQTIQEAEREAA